MTVDIRVWKLLDEWGIVVPNEEDVWRAIAEVYNLDYYEIADGDLTEWL